MRPYLFAIVPLFVGSLACGGSAFTSPDDDGGTGQGGAGGGATTTTNATTTTTTIGTTATVSSTNTTNGTTTTIGVGIGGAGGFSTTGGGGDGPGGSGGNGTGGRFDGGPTGGSGGQIPDARVDAPIPCDAAAPSPVSFRMTTAPGSAFCINNCLQTWLTIFPVGGTTPLNVTRGCSTTCDQCQPIACAGGDDNGASTAIACAPPQPVNPQGEMYTWSGTMWAQGKCGPLGYSCVNQVCGTPPGKYIARMCANRRTSDAGTFCMSETVQTCVDVTFEYPATGVVEGMLP